MTSSADQYTPPLPARGEPRPYTYSERKKRMSTSVKANRLAVLALGEQLRTILHSEGNMIKDRKYHLRTYKMCIVGQEMVDWLVERGEVDRREEGVEVMQKLLEYGIIHHVCDDHTFKDDRLFYRFRRDDGTYQGPPDPPVVARGQRLYSRLRDVAGFLADRKYHLTTYKRCFVGNELVDWLVANGEVKDREEGMELGRQLLESGTIRHVCNDHHFKDDFLFYRFVNDDTTPRSIKERLGLGGSRKEKRKVEDSAHVEEDPEIYSEVGPETEENDIEDAYQKMSSGPAEDSYIVINKGNSLMPDSNEGSYMSPRPVDTPPDVDAPPDLSPTQRDSTKSISSVIGRIPSWEELLAPGAPYAQKEVEVKSDAVGFGFIIRGRGPVYIHTVDQNGPAAAVGLTVGELLLEVNGLDVRFASHKDVAQIILRGSGCTALKTLVRTPPGDAAKAEGSSDNSTQQ